MFRGASCSVSAYGLSVRSCRFSVAWLLRGFQRTYRGLKGFLLLWMEFWIRLSFDVHLYFCFFYFFPFFFLFFMFHRTYNSATFFRSFFPYIFLTEKYIFQLGDIFESDIIIRTKQDFSFPFAFMTFSWNMANLYTKMRLKRWNIGRWGNIRNLRIVGRWSLRRALFRVKPLN